jgi:hypothetical protein
MTLQELVSGLKGRTADAIPQKLWNPQLHFTDALDNPYTPLVKALLDKYGQYVEYWYAYSPFGPNSYSIELQFDKKHRAAMGACRMEYQAIPTGVEDEDEDDNEDE